jgi:hypothetical protein
LIPPALAGRSIRVLRVALSYYVTLGLSAALGLALISVAMHLWVGAFAAAAALVGVIVAIPPDQPAPRRGKVLVAPRRSEPSYHLGRGTWAKGACIPN